MVVNNVFKAYHISHMNKSLLFALRITLGWLFFYAGITKVLNPDWTSAGYLNSALSLHGLYAWFASPGIIGVVDFLNEWGLTLVGVSLIIGAFVRLSGWLGALLMALYYVPILAFPRVGAHYAIVDEHVIFATCLLLLAESQGGRYLGFDGWLMSQKKWKSSAFLKRIVS